MANEKRLIDANDAEKSLFALRKGFRKTEEKCAVGACILEIRDIRTVDAVEVVRCEKCQYFTADPFSPQQAVGECDCPYIFMSDGARLYPAPDDFCNYGERRNDDG